MVMPYAQRAGAPAFNLGNIKEGDVIETYELVEKARS